MADFKEEVLQKLRANDVYECVKGQKTGTNDWVNGFCPFHEDVKTRSFSFNARTLAWKCFAGCGQGDVFSFVMRQKELPDFKSALDYLGGLVGLKRPEKKNKKPKPPIPESMVSELAEKLPPEAKKYLNDRGISDTSIQKYQLGWDAVRRRISIPVRDEKGNLVNVRYYSWTQKLKIFNHIVKIEKNGEKEEFRYGPPARLFGLPDLLSAQHRKVFLVEGEFDAILLGQESGVPTVSGTHGAGTFPSAWIKYFAEKDVVIIYDCDSAGVSNSNKLIVPAIRGQARSVKNVLLPLKGTKDDKDITDWFIKRGKTWEELQVVIEATPEWEPPREEEEDIIDLESFLQVEEKKYIDKKIRCEIVVCGETGNSFHAAEEFEVTACNKRDKGDCYDCPPRESVVVKPGAREYIGSCMSPDVQVIHMLRMYCCKKAQRPCIEITKRTTVREFFCHQKVSRPTNANFNLNDFATNNLNQELVEKKVYFLSAEILKPGPYLAVGWVKTHPKTQHITMLFESLEPQEDDYQAYDFKENIHLLKEYQKLTIPEILKDISTNVTRIYQRQELHLASLLTLFSPLWLPFNSEIIRGWLFVIVMGDSGQGKGYVTNSLAAYTGVGDILAGVTSSRTGLAYALYEHKTQGWMIKTGRYPANDGKFLAVDEAQHLSIDDVRTLSNGIETGFFQVDKVKSGGFSCRTRLILICNPEKDKTMDSVTFGCETLKYVFPSPILRRVDFAVFVNTSDIDEDIVNQPRRKTEGGPKISPEMLRAVIYWVWNLSPTDIEFQPDAESMCLNEAGRLSRIYGEANEIPLIAPADCRNALARISAAFAALDMSASKKFDKLFVLEKHVVMTVKMLEKIYNHDNCALDEYAAIVRYNTQLHDYDVIKDAFLKKHKDGCHSTIKNEGSTFTEAVKLLRVNETIRRDDLADQLGIIKENVSEIISFLRRFNLVDSTRKGYIKKPKFIKFLRRFIKEFPEMFSSEFN
jgi:DNA primase